MTLVVLAALAAALAGLYAAVTAVNLRAYRTPPLPDPGAPRPEIAVLVPARDEAANIGALLDSVLASEGVDFEVVVLDDGSTDATGAIVATRAARDPRVRLVTGAPLPDGWVGKQHACWLLSQATRRPLMVFVDADVRLGPDALARLTAFMTDRLDLASGFPRQITVTLGEQLVIPQILVLLLGYLPLPMARRSTDARFAAACGQLVAVRRDAYLAAGGHHAIRGSMHDGLSLPRAIRAAGGRTDLCDATGIATCRMYRSWPEVWTGFVKNAREGMATPVGLPIWTLLLGGGHIAPFVLALVALLTSNPAALGLALAAIALVWGARVALALRMRQSPLSVLLHPVGMTLVLAIQWTAFVAGRRGRRSVWRGRVYDA